MRNRVRPSTSRALSKLLHLLSVGLAMLAAPGVAANRARPTSIGPWTSITDQADFSPRDTANGAVFLGKMWLSNGYPDWSTDLWSSSDGVSWEKVLDNTPYDIFSHLVVYEGKLWAISSSVWSSEDGVTWVEVLDGTPFIYGNDVVVHNGRMWALGNGPEVWSSTDGVNWTFATLNAPYGDRASPAVAVFDGKLWLMGGSTPAPGKGYSDPEMLGYPDLDMNNDVWSSTDGATWTLVTQHAPWIGRMWFSAQSYSGGLWIMAGYDNDHHENLGDTWYTADGVNWEQEVQSDLSWSPRHYPTTFVFNDSLWIAAGNSWPFQNDVWKLTVTPDPVATATTLQASVNPSTYGQSITLTATVTPAAASGTVTFEEGSRTLGTAEVTAGTAAFTTSAFTLGAHDIAASYSGDAGHLASTDAISIEVLPVGAPPLISESFSDAAIPLNGTTTLTFSLSNPNPTAPLSEVGFTDTLPGGLMVATPSALTGTCGGGAINATEGSSNISLSGATLASSGSCSFSVNVIGTSGGTKSNATDPVTSADAGMGNSATANLDVVAPPSIATSFGSGNIPLHGTTSLTFTISNPSINAVSLTGVGFSDALSSGLTVASPANITGSCGGTITATAGTTSITLSAATLATSSSCTFSVDVLGVVAGIQNDSTTTVTSANGGEGNSATATLDVLGPDLTVAKSHAGDFTEGDTGKAYTITVRNAGAVPTSGVITVVDVLPSGLTATAMSGTGWTCNLDTLTCTRSDELLNGSSLPPITVTVNVGTNASNLTNTATVSGGGEINVDNDSASDATTVHSTAPTNVTATAISSSQVIVTWIGVPNAMSYQVFRRSAPGPYGVVGSSTTSNFADSGLIANTAYLYYVRAVDSSNNAGPTSNIDLATTTIFTDDPVVAGSTVIRSAHLAELRMAVSAVRAAAGVPAASFSDSAPGVIIRADHLMELRSNLDAARTALFLPAIPYTDPTLTAGDTIKAVHIQELRNGVK